MKALLVTITAIFALVSAHPAEAGRCSWLKRREFVRYELEKTARGQFAKPLDRKLDEFLDGISAVDREGIRDYFLPEFDRKDLIARLRRRLGFVVKDFNFARCSKGAPVIIDGTPSPNTCFVSDEEVTYLRPTSYRALRLTADKTGVYVEGELRQDSRRRFVQARGEFEAGGYFVRIRLGVREEERRQLTATQSEFNFADFEEYLEEDSRWPPECKPEAPAEPSATDN